MALFFTWHKKRIVDDGEAKEQKDKNESAT